MMRSFYNILSDTCRRLIYRQYSKQSYPGKKIEVNKINIHYEEVGNGNYKLLLIPGALGSTRTDFGPQLEKLDKSKFTLISWDPPGYGFSIPPERTFPRNFYQRDAHLAAALMKKLGHHKYSILGWSDGGTMGLIIAANYPDIVQKLAIWGSTAYFTNDDILMMNAARDIQQWNRKMLEPMLALYGEEYFRKMWHSYLDAVQDIVSNGGDLCKDDLKKIQCETLILHGDKDPLVPFFHIPYLLENIKNSKCYRFPEGRHNIHLRYADEFNEQILKFLL
ncbi:valacyclovir hydrolase [Centruroides vittatus]|uniref:valacyclovir hydrolase n=1 Tax=Centruroides vittatus TaxID=120091 RepID=UPI0035100B46